MAERPGDERGFRVVPIALDGVLHNGHVSRDDRQPKVVAAPFSGARVRESERICVSILECPLTS